MAWVIVIIRSMLEAWIMKKSFVYFGVLAGAFALAGCSFQSNQGKPPLSQQSSTLPEWIAKPSYQGLSAIGCVPSTGNLGMDIERSELQATAQLGSMIGQQLQSMRESYQRALSAAHSDISMGANFESVTRSIVNERMVGVYRTHSDQVAWGDGSTQFCSQVAIGDSHINELLAQVASLSGNESGAFTQDQYRELYMSQQAFNRLNQQLVNQQSASIDSSAEIQ